MHNGPAGLRRSRARRPGVIVAMVLSLVGLVACSAERPGPGRTVEALAAGMASMDLMEVPFGDVGAGEAGRQLSTAVAGMGERRPAVTVQSTETEDDDATAVLAYRWDLDDSDEDWTYTTTAQLAYEPETEEWAVEWAPDILAPGLVEDDQLEVATVDAERAPILGFGDAVLVTNLPVARMGIDKTQVDGEQAVASARSLAAVLDLDADALADRVAAAGPEAFVEAVVLRTEVTPIDEEAVAAIPGVIGIPDELPLAPTREFARPILGTVGAATAELIAASGGKLEEGDLTGLSGLQERYDEQLRGRPGIVIEAVPTDPQTGPIRELFRQDATPGQPVATTLDLDLQLAAEDALATVGPPSAIAAVRPSTGEVLAAASGPGGQGYSTVTLGRYAPGSTFKVVTALGLLRAGLTPDSDVACTPTITVDGKSFTNYDDYPTDGLGDITLRSAIADSCNTALIAERDELSQDALADAATTLGLGVEQDPGVPFFFGAVPAEAGETEHAASMIGQGRVEASPLAMAAVAASVARGETVRPHLLRPGPAAVPKSSQPLQPAAAQELREMMRAVVTEGSAPFLADVPGEDVLAKSGTAEYGTEQPPRTHAWMIAVHGDLAVAVFVEDGVSGSVTAGPIMEAFLGGAP